jgi:hypothetical protein
MMRGIRLNRTSGGRVSRNGYVLSSPTAVGWLRVSSEDWFKASLFESKEEAVRQMMSADIHAAAAFNVLAVTPGGFPLGGFVACNVSFIGVLFGSL